MAGGVVLLALLVAVAFGQAPDRGGYRWQDSDSAGGPAFDWVDVSAGTQLALGDDDNQGPFALGFSFPFYSATVESVRVCSNGWLSFTSSSHQYHHYAIPDTRDPNSLIAPLWADLDPTAGGDVRYWADTTGQRFIVAWLGVPFRGGADTCSFEAILDTGGSVVFQYLTVPLPLRLGTDSCTVGIENETGTAGSEYLLDAQPAANLLHDSLAVRFYRLHHDVMPEAVLRPDTNVLYHDSIIPLVRVWNAGLDTASFGVELRIGTGYDEQVTVTGLAGLADSLVVFPVWVAEDGLRAVSAVTTLVGDECAANDTLQVTSTGAFQGELRYDDGVRDTTFIRNGSPTTDWGAAVRFSIPWRGWAVTGVRVFVADTLPFERVLLCPDSSGLPGIGQSSWWADSVRADTPGSWLELPAASGGNENPDIWLVAFWPRHATGPAIGEDRSAPIDGRSWYGSPTVRWFNYTTGDLMMRLSLVKLNGVEEAATVAQIAPPPATVVRGVLRTAVSRQQTEYRGKLLDVTGRSVLDLQAGANDVRGLAPGVYFIRTQVAGSSEQVAVRRVLLVR
jgi:hypothetical protein